MAFEPLSFADAVLREAVIMKARRQHWLRTRKLRATVTLRARLGWGPR